MAVVLGALAAVPLAAALRAVVDSGFRPGNFQVELIALTGFVLAAMAVAWILKLRGGRRVMGWMLTVGALFGLVVGVYGIWGTSVLVSDCADIRPVASTVASSTPAGYCGSEAQRDSFLIGCYMIAVGAVSIASLASSAWINRSYFDPALD
jgi:hypothetical protein